MDRGRLQFFLDNLLRDGNINPSFFLKMTTKT